MDLIKQAMIIDGATEKEAGLSRGAKAGLAALGLAGAGAGGYYASKNDLYGKAKDLGQRALNSARSTWNINKDVHETQDSNVKGNTKSTIKIKQVSPKMQRENFDIMQDRETKKKWGFKDRLSRGNAFSIKHNPSNETLPVPTDEDIIFPSIDGTVKQYSASRNTNRSNMFDIVRREAYSGRKEIDAMSRNLTDVVNTMPWDSSAFTENGAKPLKGKAKKLNDVLRNYMDKNKSSVLKKMRAESGYVTETPIDKIRNLTHRTGNRIARDKDDIVSSAKGNSQKVKGRLSRLKNKITLWDQRANIRVGMNDMQKKSLPKNETALQYLKRTKDQVILPEGMRLEDKNNGIDIRNNENFDLRR